MLESRTVAILLENKCLELGLWLLNCKQDCIVVVETEKQEDPVC